MNTMTELHPSVSAVGSHLDEENEIAALAHHYYEEEGCPEGHSLDHWMRAKREYDKRHSVLEQQFGDELAITESGARTEEMMHLDQ